MEEICIRFPHIMEQINKDLDFDTMVKLRESNRIVCNVVDNQRQGRFFWISWIPSNLRLSSIEFKEDWKNVFMIKETEYLKKIVIHIQNFFTSKPSRRNKNWSPMHIASAQGDLELCKKIAEVTNDKSFLYRGPIKVDNRNPQSKDKWTPLHFAAQSGNLEICKFLSENLQDKNPRTNIGITPLHLTAKNGHLEIYKFICETVARKNPAMDKDITPLHLAAKHNQIEVCKFVCENVQNVSPKIRENFGFFDGSLTPLTFAINRGNVKVAKIIMKYDQNNFCYYVTALFFFIMLGLIYWLILSLFINGFIIISDEDCSNRKDRKKLESKCTFLFHMLLLVYAYCPFIWPYLLYGRFVLLYFRDMSLTNYIHQTFDH